MTSSARARIQAYLDTLDDRFPGVYPDNIAIDAVFDTTHEVTRPLTFGDLRELLREGDKR